MGVDKNSSEGAGASAGGDVPDWSTWLRSRLERVVPAERNATDDGGGSEATSPDADLASPTGPPAPGDDPVTTVVGDAALAALDERLVSLLDATTACRALVEEQGATSERLAAWMQELATTQADDERWAVAVSRAVDETDEERREAGERAEATLANLASRVERIEDGLGQISAEIAGLRLELTRPAATPVKLGEPQLRAIAGSIAAALATRSAAVALPPVPEVAPPPSPREQPEPGARPVRGRRHRASPLRATPPPPSTRP